MEVTNKNEFSELEKEKIINAYQIFKDKLHGKNNIMDCLERFMKKVVLNNNVINKEKILKLKYKELTENPEMEFATLYNGDELTGVSRYRFIGNELIVSEILSIDEKNHEEVLNRYLTAYYNFMLNNKIEDIYFEVPVFDYKYIDLMFKYNFEFSINELSEKHLNTILFHQQLGIVREKAYGEKSLARRKIKE